MRYFFSIALLSLFLSPLWIFVNGTDKALLEEVKKTLGNLRKDFKECMKESLGLKKNAVDEDTKDKKDDDEKEKKDDDEKEDPDCPAPPEENEDWCCVEPVNTHTMCKFQGIAEQCKKKVVWSGLTMVGKEALVDKHNELRNSLANGDENGQPQAANMKIMVWSDELAEVAQRWTDQCFFEHDDNRNNLDGGPVGQNAFNAMEYRFLPARIKRSQQEFMTEGKSNVSINQMVMTNTYREKVEGTKANYEMRSQRLKRSNEQVELTEEGRSRLEAKLGVAVESWYSEVKDPGFDSKHIEPFVFNAGSGHYTQVVWADTEEVGCGWILFETNIESGVQFYDSLVVCNYFPAANVVGGAMYLQEAPTSKCPEGYYSSLQSKYPNLCEK